MNSHSKRSMISTAALMFFLGIALHQQWEWLPLIVPGAVLIWIALVMPAPEPRLQTAKKALK